MGTVKYLHVLLRGEYVADIVRTRSETLRLTYLKSVRDDQALSLSLPPGIDHTGEPVTIFLKGLIPEGSDIRRHIVRGTRLDPDDNLDVLSLIGLDCPGAVQFVQETELEQAVARSGALEEATDSDIEARLSEFEMDEDASWLMREQRWSLSGTQQKFTLRWHSDHWNYAYGAEPTSHIVKPGIRSLRLQALAEHLTMRAATILGINTAETNYTDFKSMSALVVTRFDRATVAEGLTRLHQEDLGQAMSARHKYQEDGGPSAADIVQFLDSVSLSGRDSRHNIASFLNMVIFNTIVAAPDAHTRNFALFLEQGRPLLTPMFDAATALAHDAVQPRSVAMSIGGTRLVQEIGLDHWKQFAADCSQPEDQVLETVGTLATNTPAAFASALAELSSPDAEAFAARITTPLKQMCEHFLGSVGR